MPSAPSDVLPVLVADLVDTESKDVLDEAASRAGAVYVPLATAPVNATQHVLEVNLPGATEPILYIAEPLGPPTIDGFPLRIRPMRNAAPPAPPKHASSGQMQVVRTRATMHGSVPPLTASHQADLSYMGPPPKEEDQLLGRAIAGGKLSIEELIGEGAVGAVYRARHRALGMEVAVKVLHESFQHDIDFCRRFYAEALAASKLDHPNITRVIDFGQEPDGMLYFAMEYLKGMDLRTLLEKELVLPLGRIVELMMQVCAGLSQAHARGIVHRDIKPENVVLVAGQDDDGRPCEIVKICDFGIAQHRAGGMKEGEISGTPEYMSPEQCRSEELDARSDVYACGIVLYELATGKVPFTADHPAFVLRKHMSAQPPPPTQMKAGLDPRLEKIILKALAKSPADRQPGMRELRAELRELVKSPAKPPPPPARPAAAQPPPVPRKTEPTPARLPSARELPELMLDGAGPVTRREPEVRAPLSSDRLELAVDLVATRRVDPAPPPPTPDLAVTSRRFESSPDLGVPSAVGMALARGVMPNAAPSVDDLADLLAQNAAAWLQRVNEPAAFVQVAPRLEAALRALAARGELRALWTASSILHGMEWTGPAKASALQVLRVLDDPAVLGSIAERLLTGRDESREVARKLLIRSGVAGAYGLYGARVKLAADANTRAPFVAAMTDIGLKAWPVVRAGLEKLLTGDQHARAMELAEDLLRCVPAVADETGGHLVLKYLRVGVPGVCRSATAAIVKLWGDRARPLLVGMLQNQDDVVRIAGIAGLRQLDALDEQIVPRLQAILARRVPASEELRAAAALALASASPSARQPAISALAQALAAVPRDDARSTRTMGAGPLSREDAVVVAIARALLQAGGQSYRTAVSERAERSSEPLRGELRRLLG